MVTFQLSHHGTAPGMKIRALRMARQQYTLLEEKAACICRVIAGWKWSAHVRPDLYVCQLTSATESFMSKSNMFMLSLQPFMNVMCLILQLSVFLSVPAISCPLTHVQKC